MLSAHTVEQMAAPLGTEPLAWVFHVQLLQCPRGLPICVHIAHHQGVVNALLTHQGASGDNCRAERDSFIWSSFYPLLFLSFLFAQGSSSLPTYPHVSTLWPPPNKESPFPLALLFFPSCQMPSVLRVVCGCWW